jgi:hypothetical protein
MGRGRSGLRHAAAAAGLVALLTAAALAGTPTASAGSAAAEGDPVLLDFEDAPAATGSQGLVPVSAWYQDEGVLFDDGVVAARASARVAGEAFPRSGEVVLASCPGGTPEGLRSFACAGSLGMDFTVRTTSVAVHVRSARQLEADTVARLTLRDSSGAVVATEDAVVPAAGAVPAWTRLSVSSAEDIRRAEVAWVDSAAGFLAIDDLELTPYLPGPLLSTDRGALEIETGDEVVREVLRVTNVGDAPTDAVGIAFVPAVDGPADPGVASLALDDPDCLDDLSPGKTCPLVVEVRPVGAGLLEGEIEVFRDTGDPDDTGDPGGGEVLLAIPVEVSVGEVPPPPTTAPPTDGPTQPTDTAAPTEPTDTAAPSPGPSSEPGDGPGGGDEADVTVPTGGQPWYRDLVDTVAAGGGTWLLPVLLAIGVAVGFLARGRGLTAHRRRPSVPTGAAPEVVVRPDRGSVTVDQPGESRLTLTVRTPPATVLPQEEEP